MRTNGVSGDTAYLAPGVFREIITVTVAPTSTTKVIGDPQNRQGFKTSGGVRVPPAIVRWTGFTNDLGTVGGTPVALNATDYWWFQDIFFNGGNGAVVSAATLTSTNIVVTNCVISWIAGTSPNVPILVTAGFGVPLNWRISNCKIFSPGNNTLTITHTSGTGSDWNLNFVIENCEFISNGNTGIQIAKSGTAVNVGGGVCVTNCTILGLTCISATASSTNNFTNYVVNCFLVGGTGLSAGDVSQISEDYNWINCGTARANVNTGANSKTGFNPIIDFDGSRMFGFGPRPFWSPHSTSPMIGAGTTAETVDLFNKTRPSPNTIGAYETYPNVETSHSFAQ